MRKLVKSKALYAGIYILFMLPTYFLPYIVSNPYIIGLDPGFWFHLGSLIMLVILTWHRGPVISKGWLVIFPLLAIVFYLMPLINNILIIPTVMHLRAIILGVVGGDRISNFRAIETA